MRLAATERIHDPELLAGLARSFRGRDKRLYRLVSERLEAVRRRETERLRAAALLDELDALAARARLEAEDVVRAAALEREFGQLPAEADDPARRQAAQARLAPLLAAHQAHGVAVARCLRALDAIAAGFAAHGDATACASALAGLEAEAPADPRIVVRMQALRERLAERGRDTAHAEARERWLNALETQASIDAATRARLEAEWQALPAPADATLRRRQDERARARLAQLLAAQPAPAPTQSSAPKPAAPRRAPAEPDAQLLARLGEQPFEWMTPDLRIAWLRAHALGLMRLGPATAEQRAVIAQRLLPLEHELLVATVALAAAGRIALDGERVRLDGARLAAPLLLERGRLHVR